MNVSTPGPEETTAQLILVDDHELVRQGLRALLDAEPGFSVLGETGNLDAVPELVQRLQPDIVLLDVRMGKRLGCDVIPELKRVRPETRVLMLSAFNEPREVFESLSAGAQGFILKDADAASLCDAIRRCLKGERILSPRVTDTLVEGMQQQQNPEDRAIQDKLQSLSRQETRVLMYVSQGLTNKEIAERMDLSPRTIKNYFSTVMEKLGVARRAEAAAIYARHLRS